MSSSCTEEGLHGGTEMYCRNDIEAIAREPFILEVSAIQFNVESVKFLVNCAYRVPDSDLRTSLRIMENMLNGIVRENCTLFLVGDFNIDFLASIKESGEILSLLNSFNLVQTIFEFTQKCIDNISTNLSNYETQILNYQISDHLGQQIRFFFKF